MDVLYPSTPSSLYDTLNMINRSKMDHANVHLPAYHVHAPNGLERVHLSRSRDMACRVGGSAHHCANASAGLEMYRQITNRDIAEIVPAHAQLPSQVQVLNHVKNVNESAYNKQLSLEAVHADMKRKFPQSYGFFTEPWTIRTPVCSGADCRQSGMTLDNRIYQTCQNAVRKF